MKTAGSLAGTLLFFFLFLNGANATTETVLYSFCSKTGCPDGEYPGGLTAVNGMLYGTTYSGGASDKGTVFSIDPTTGTETVLYSFCSRKKCADGEWPGSDALINVKGTLYGTTTRGGDGAKCQIYGKQGYIGCGTLFSVNPQTGAETVVYSFCSRSANCTDGLGPEGSLINVGGTLYGTTYSGGTGCYQGACGTGTVFAIDPATGTETVIYSFCSQANCTDGFNPQSGVTEVNGMLYGTTLKGGSGGGGGDCGFGCGTAFTLDPATGAETVLHDFCSEENCSDGDDPSAGLIAVNGALYGMTAFGGSGTRSRMCKIEGCGMVFSLDPQAGTETVVYSFCSRKRCGDGQIPVGDVIDLKGTLYGVTQDGGDGSCKRGCGTVFSLDPKSGAETVLYSFQGGESDGNTPTSGVINVGGTLYGTTLYGGAHGKGTVFAISP